MFLASVLAKPFVILTGLAASGKTQLAKRLGHRLGRERTLLVPVRPDWTGPEALLGYEDALRPGLPGDPRRPRVVPDVLAFVLRAASAPSEPAPPTPPGLRLAFGWGRIGGGGSRKRRGWVRRWPPLKTPTFHAPSRCWRPIRR